MENVDASTRFRCRRQSIVDWRRRGSFATSHSWHTALTACDHASSCIVMVIGGVLREPVVGHGRRGATSARTDAKRHVVRRRWQCRGRPGERTRDDVSRRGWLSSLESDSTRLAIDWCCGRLAAWLWVGCGARLQSALSHAQSSAIDQRTGAMMLLAWFVVCWLCCVVGCHGQSVATWFGTTCHQWIRKHGCWNSTQCQVCLSYNSFYFFQFFFFVSVSIWLINQIPIRQ